MLSNIAYEKCLSFINIQLRPADAPKPSLPDLIRPVITISRMTGSGGRTIALELADYLQTKVPTDCHWTVFDRNLIGRVLEDHALPRRLAAHMPESRIPALVDAFEEMLGLHPDSWSLVEKTAQTISRLAQLGYVIIVGRGANLITRELKSAFHVRLIGSLEQRARRVEHIFGFSPREALRFIQKEDSGRARYLKQFFGKEIDDPLLYHVLINTDLTAYSEIARWIGDEVISRFHMKAELPAKAA